MDTNWWETGNRCILQLPRSIASQVLVTGTPLRRLTLSFVPDWQHAMDPNWSETGNRYILQLFRDYVYHQIDEEGNPVVDLGHIVHSLNKVRSLHGIY
jgi:Lon protease-like protein